MKSIETKAIELVRTIARMERCDFDVSDNEIEDALETLNSLIFRAREIMEMPKM